MKIYIRNYELLKHALKFLFFFSAFFFIIRFEHKFDESIDEIIKKKFVIIFEFQLCT